MRTTNHHAWRPRFDRIMANDHMVAVVLAGGEGRRLLPLTAQRAKPAVPFAGCYRLIDFTLSNCINSGLRRIVIITGYQAESVAGHLRPLSARLRSRGIEIRSVFASGDASRHPIKGTAGAVLRNLRAILESAPDYILVLSSDHVYRMDYSTMLDFHRRTGSEATVACTEVELPLASSFGVLSVSGQGLVCDFAEKPTVPKALPGNPANACASMGIYLFNREALIELLKKDVLCLNSSHDFGKDILPVLHAQKRLHAYSFSNNSERLSSYWCDVGTIDAYFQSTMDMLEPARFPLHDPYWPLYTSLPDFRQGVLQMQLHEHIPRSSLIPAGCEIHTSSIERSVLSPGVVIGEGTRLFEAVVFPGARIGNNVRARRCIIEEGAHVPDNTRVGYDEEEDRNRHIVSTSGVVVICNKQTFGGDNEESNSGSREFGQRVFRAV